MITSGLDTLTSLVITIACITLVDCMFGLVAICCISSFWMLDFWRHGQVYPSFTPSSNPQYTYADAFLMVANIFGALATALEHFNRYEVLSEAVLMEAAGVGKPVLRAWQWKRRVSTASVVAWAVLFLLDKQSSYFLPLFRVVSSTCAFAVLLALANCAVHAWRFIWDVVHTNAKELDFKMTKHGLFFPASCELRWVDRTELGNKSMPNFLTQAWALSCWHVSSRSNVASAALNIYLTFLLPIMPAVQYEVFAAALLWSVGNLLFSWQMRQNPLAFLNASGSDIPAAYAGFGMLVEKGQLLRAAASGAASCVRMKMVPATVERVGRSRDCQLQMGRQPELTTACLEP